MDAVNKMYKKKCFCVFILVLSFPCNSLPLVIPEDVATSFAAIFGFAPPLHKGHDLRFGYGFRFGNHADFQILYEFGPQTITKPLQQRDLNIISLQRPSKIKPAIKRQRTVKRRPLINLLLKTGILKKASYNHNVITDCDN